MGTGRGSVYLQARRIQGKEKGNMKKGLIYIFTGDGKGKTSAAIGVGVRAALSGMKVAMVCWYKEPRWPISENKLNELFTSRTGRKSRTSRMGSFEIYLLGKGFYKLPTNHAKPGEHKQAAKQALEKAKSLMRKADVLILDEVNNAVSDRLIKASEVVDLLKKRGKTHVVLTGRNTPKSFVKFADLVTEMKKVKHPFDLGKKAIKGLDY